MDVKDGVNFSTLKPTLKMAAKCCERIFKDKGYAFTVTSTGEGIHKKGSLHYCGLAFDCRTRHITGTALPFIYQAVVEYLRNIDWRFQVINDTSVDNPHFHIEFDRRMK